jgi:metallophosphoesterase superfamily enzyme
MNEIDAVPGVQLLDDWLLAPEGAAIHPAERTAVIADVHLGYEWARAAGGDRVIAPSLVETRSRLSRLLDRAPLARLVVAGDLVESPRPCPLTRADVHRLREWLTKRGVTLVALAGNHDGDASWLSPGADTGDRRMLATYRVGSWTIAHGHRPMRGTRTVSGHHHPVFCGAGTAAPCFVVGPGRIVLPAFSANAAGCDVGRSAVPRDWLTSPMHCIVSTGEELLDFGLLAELRRGLGRSPARRVRTAPR